VHEKAGRGAEGALVSMERTETSLHWGGREGRREGGREGEGGTEEKC